MASDQQTPALWDRRRFLTVSGAAAAGTVLTASALTAPAAAAQRTRHAGGLRLADAQLRATHNSYSGDLEGAKGPILHQLDWGSRFVELDIWSTNHATLGDYQIGHDAPDDDEVDHSGGNPTSALLADWLTQVATWSKAHPQAAPIVVMLDMKTDLGRADSYAAGNLIALNDEVTDVFGPLLFPSYAAPDGPGELPVDALRGRILAQLSGNVNSRMGYLRQTADQPAVALDAGDVVEVHDDPVGQSWWWSGRFERDQSVSWRRYGRLDAGVTPAVALTDDGTVVAVYRGQADAVIHSKVGTLGDDGEITWGTAQQVDTGVLPTIAVTQDRTVRVVFRDAANDRNRTISGTVDPTVRTVAWDAASRATTTDLLLPKNVARTGRRRITVDASWDSPMDPQTLTYSTPGVTDGLIRPRQVLFNEYQNGNSSVLAEHAPFWGATASNSAFMLQARAARKITRAWDFDDPKYETDPLANFPATNYPYSDWYEALMQKVGAIS